MTYANPEDVATRLGRSLSPEESGLVAARLADVERRITRRIPDLADRIGTGALDPDDVVQVEADVVLRLVRNPEGYTSETDGNYTYVFSREAASGRLELTRDDWATLGVRFGMTQLVPSLAGPARTPFGMGG